MPPSPVRFASFAALAFLAALAAPALASPLATFENRSTPTRCAEDDNVSFLARGRVRGFRVVATHPRYLPRVTADSTEPDFTGCEAQAADPVHRFTPRVAVLHEDRRSRLVGITLDGFWRPAVVPVRVVAGGRTLAEDRGFHLLQLYLSVPGTGGEKVEALVLYPADGNWRVKPLPTRRLGTSAYGSSIQLGPLSSFSGPAARPVVDIAEVAYDPRARSFALRFADGSRVRVRVAQASRARLTLDVVMTPASDGDGPFAALRSMFVAPGNADAERVRLGTRGAVRAIMAPGSFRTARASFERPTLTRRNTSAPDLAFERFR